MKPVYQMTPQELRAKMWCDLDDLIRAAKRLTDTTERLNPDYTREQAKMVALYAVKHLDEWGGRPR